MIDIELLEIKVGIVKAKPGWQRSFICLNAMTLH